MSAPQPHEISGLVLAGGAGRRMGGADKGWQPWQGEALITHVLARLAPQCASLLISANRNLERYRALGHPVLRDLRADFPGPLAGIEAGLAACPTPYLLCVPCDAPLLPPDLGARLAQGIGGHAASVVSLHGRWQAVFCLLRRELGAELAAALARDERAVTPWLRSIDAHAVACEDIAPAFANFNTLAALRSPPA